MIRQYDFGLAGGCANKQNTIAKVLGYLHVLLHCHFLLIEVQRHKNAVKNMH